MTLRTMAAAVALVLAPLAATAQSHPIGHRPGEQAAIEACIEISQDRPARAILAVEDAFDGYLVRLEDPDGDVWTCHAGEDGRAYFDATI